MPDTTYADLSADRELDEANRALSAAHAAIGAFKVAMEQTDLLSSYGNITDIVMAGVDDFVKALIADDLVPVRDMLQERVNELLGERMSTSPYDRAHAGYGGGL